MSDRRTILGSENKPLSSTTQEGVTSLYTVPGITDVELAVLDYDDVATTTAYMLVDLSDTINWPHTETGHINLEYLLVTLDPDTSYRGDITFGFLSNVDDENGDLNIIHEIHLDKKAEPEVVVTMNFGAFGISMETNHWFGPTTANSTLFQTDVSLAGPNGNASFPSGNGDLVVIVSRSAGEISFSISAGYVTM